MKGLLQSKIFKKSLKKWLLMYVMCMGLFTTVVTYSKYISNMLESDDVARVSKFNINLQYCNDELCEDDITEADTKVYRPTSNMEYYFALDTSNLEVNADLFITISVDEHFKIDKIEKILGGKYSDIDSSSKDTNNKTQTISDKAIAGNKEKIKYKVTVSYDETVKDYNNSGNIINGVIKDSQTGLPQYIFNENNVYNVLTIGYSATQTR